MVYKIFIGYSGEDEKSAQYVYDCLKRIIEFEPYKAEIYPDYGEDFKKRIENELDNSQFMVVLLTSNGIRSQWVNQEIGYAYALKKRPRLLPALREQPHIIPISESQTELKGFITKDSIDILFLDKLPWELVIASIILKIRNYIPRGLKEGMLHLRTTCSNCTDTKGLPFEFDFPMPAHETIRKAIESNMTALWINCPQCHAKNYVDMRTFLPLRMT